MIEMSSNRRGIDLPIRSQLYALIFLFSFLLFGMILSTAISVWDHAGEDKEVEIVNHQRILLQKTADLFSNDAGEEIDLAGLIQSLEQNLSALKDGGIGVTADGVVEVPPLHQGSAQDQLDEIIKAWPSYRSRLEAIRVLPDDDPGRSLQEEKALKEYFILAGHLDSIVIGLEKHLAGEHRLLLNVQLAGLFLAFPLILWGSNIIRHRIVHPLEVLRQAAVQLRQGDSSPSLNLKTNDEIADLARSFEKMRSEILKNKQILEDQVSERTHELSVAFEFSQEIASQLDYDSLFANITAKARALMGTEHISVCLVRPDGNSVEQVATSRGVLAGGRLQQSVSHIREVVGQSQILEAQVSELACQFIQSHSAGRCLATPLRVGDRTIGALCVLRNPALSYGENEKRALSLLANSAAVAIENVRLIKENERRSREIAVFAERQRFGSDLHDNLAQTLNTINLKISQLQNMAVLPPNVSLQARMEEVKSNVMTAIEQLRMYMSEMVSSDKEQANESLTQLNLDVKKFMAATGIQVEIEGLEDSLNNDLSALAQKQLLMIITESFTNIQRHAEAKNVMIHFSEDQDRLRVTIEDDGKGFDPGTVQGKHHLGMRIMRTRAERVGGTLSVISAPGEGTQITASFPLQME